jgi:membrane-bound serine protease (ClpP class)
MTLSKYFGALPVFNALVLQPEAAAKESQASADARGKPYPQTPRSSVAVGDWGVTESPLRPAGRAKFGDHRCDVITKGEFVARGRQIRVLEIHGGTILVCDVEEESA